ncbi:MAG: hypothetical protein HYW24_01150 [Candidatus Aenigmarchaeota archaeon]|nr:hypothetical protein [Candidatus Aenigmarchaeota archaeon]
MGIFDTVYFTKYCSQCGKKTEWSAQFKWEYKSQTTYKFGEKMWRVKIRYMWDKKSHLQFGSDMQEKIKHFSGDIDGIAQCEECEKMYYEEYWKLKRRHWERTKCDGISESFYKRGKTYGKGMFKWKQKKDERILFGICTCGALDRMIKKRKLKRVLYDCTVEIRHGVIKSVDDFKMWKN